MKTLLVLMVLVGTLLGTKQTAQGRDTARPPHYSLWMCVHRQERTAWNDPNAPYWGGLQMGSWFLSYYAHPPGYPNQWTPLQQMWVAENAYRRERYSRSWLYGQWPPSRGVCF